MSLFLNPWGLLALAAVPAVVGLHLFRRRFQPHVISALFLWSAVDRSPVAGRKIEPLHQNPSFWLELAAALLFAMAFAGLRLPWLQEAQHLVVVLDASASMRAVKDGETFRARAVRLVDERIDQLPLRSRVTILQTGDTPSILSGPAAFPGEAAEELQLYEPGSERHDLSPAIALGLQLAGNGSVLLVTDQFEPDAYVPEVEIASVGEPLPNVAFTHAARNRVDEDDEIFLTVTNFSKQTVNARLELKTQGTVIENRDLELTPDGRRHLSFKVPHRTPLMEARLQDDALNWDNVAYLSPTPSRTIFICTDFSEDLALFLGLRASSKSADKLDRLLSIVDDAIEVPNPATAHLMLSEKDFDAPQLWSLVCMAEGEQRRDLVGPFLAEKRHELMQGTTLDGIVWSTSPDLLLGGAPIVSAGNQPILTEVRDGERRVFRMNIDPLRSSLHRSPDWPILLTNLVEMRRSSLPGPSRTNILVGDSFLYRDTRETTYKLVGDDETIEIATRGVLVAEGVPPGRYTLQRGESDLCELGVTYCDAAESDLSKLGKGERESTKTLDAIRANFGIIDTVMLLLALLMILLDWWVLSARRIKAAKAA